MNPNITFGFTSVDKYAVINCFNGSKSNAVGSGLISLKMFKTVSIFLIKHLTHSINSCLSSSIFPKTWKLANVIPLASRHVTVKTY